MADLATAISVCEGALRNKARITALIATDAAESERSVHFEFSAEDSQSIFEVALSILQAENPKPQK